MNTNNIYTVLYIEYYHTHLQDTLFKFIYLPLFQIQVNSIVEIFLIDEGVGHDISHPIHIHGYSPYIVAMERHASCPQTQFGSGICHDSNGTPNGKRMFIN